jgi:hypothetical protein
MNTFSTTSFSSYLRQQQIRSPNRIEYHVSPRVDLICFQAHHLAQMNAQPLHPMHLLKAMLHIPGGAVEKLLTQQGVTLERVHATQLNPRDSLLDVDRFFKRTVAFVKASPAIASHHLLLSVLDEEVMLPYFVEWQVQPEKLREAISQLESNEDSDG